MYTGALVWVTRWRMVPLLKKSRWAGAGLAVTAVNHRLYYHLSPLTHLSDIQPELAAGRWLIHKEGVQWWRCLFAHNQLETQWAQHFRSMGDTVFDNQCYWPCIWGRKTQMNFKFKLRTKQFPNGWKKIFFFKYWWAYMESGPSVLLLGG